MASPYNKPDWLRMALLALAYFITARMGLTFALVGKSVTLFWPPSGLALAALLLWGSRLWPGVLMGALLANLSAGLPVAPVAGISIGSTFEAWLGAYLLNRHGRFNPCLCEMRDIFNLLFWGGLVSTLISAVNGAFWLAWPSGLIPWEHYGQITLSWWMGDALGVMLFTPAAIAFFRHPALEWTPRLRQMALWMFAILTVLCGLVFTDMGTTLFGHQPKAFLLLPVIIWAALVFNLWVVSAALLITFSSALFGMMTGVGFFSSNTLPGEVDLWLYVAVLGVTGIIVSAVNDQRKRVRKNLEQSEHNFKRAQMVANMGSWQLDVRKDLLVWSDETCRIFGIEPGAPLNLEIFLGCVHPDDRAFVVKSWQAALRGEPYDIEHRIVADGRVKWVREQAEVDFDHNGEPYNAVGTVRDVTGHKQAEESLRLAARVFESSGEAIMIADAEARIVSVNRAFTQMTGYTLEEVKGRNPNILSSGRHDAGFYRAMWESIKHDGFWQGEIWDKHKDGRIYPNLMSISAVEGERGAVTNYISISADISERKEAEQNMQFLAYFDVLTGLPNRTLLRDRLVQMLAAAHRDQQNFALLFLDLDRFKYVNDSMGHAAGDKLLQAVAQRLQECVREGDTVARVGGDEFVLLLRETNAEGAARVAGKLLKQLAIPYDINGAQISTHASVGISIYPDHGSDADALTKYADVAMYRAKDEGRNNFQFFTPEMTFHAHRLVSVEEDLRLALERNEFTLNYQPQVNLASGRICGAEALIRWKHPEKGFISPAEFIPVAEETGQIVPIGEWVLRTACAQFIAWRKQGMPAFLMAVNLSIRQLRQPNLVQLVAAILEETGMRPDDLEIELTEGIMMGETRAAMAFLTQMHEMGVKLSIDDFGTGYSSLSYLKKLPVDKLKIDQSFVRDITTDESDAAIARSIVDLGHQFNLRVIAEGVETREQLDFLRTRGCDEIQGYYFSRPLPADEFAKFIKGDPALP